MQNSFKYKIVPVLVIPEEHIALVGEPESQYLGHRTPQLVKKQNISHQVLHHISTKVQ